MSKNNPWAMHPRDAFWAEMAEFYQRCGGLMRLTLIRKSDTFVNKGIQKGDLFAINCAVAIGSAMKTIAARVDHDPAGCCGCDHVFSRGTKAPGAFVVWLPGVQEHDTKLHREMVCTPICDACCEQEDRDVLDMVVAHMRQWFDLEVITEDK